MANHQPLLSICLPTNGALESVIPVLDSIYCQTDADKCKYEVFITDNGQNSKLEAAIQPYMYHANLRYLATTDKGFLNLITSLKLGKGLFCKMLNHRSVLIPGSVNNWIAMVERYKETQPAIYCTDKSLKGEDEIFCPNFDTFIRKMSFYSSWSAGIGVWEKDKAILDKIEYNEMFPNASLLFEMCNESEYIIWNKKYQNMMDEPTKGSYNIFHTFAVVYLDLLKDLENKGNITAATFQSVKKDLRVFLTDWYYNLFYHPNQYTFGTDDCKKHILTYYSYYDYLVIKYKSMIKGVLSKVYRFLLQK